jgi:hypothetical protein
MGKAEKVALVILLTFGIVFGLIFRISLTDKTQGTRLDGFFAAEFPAVENLREDGSSARDYFEEYAKSIQEELDAAEFLITCVPTGDVKYDAGCVTTTVRITSVIRGDGIAAGDVIRVYRSGWELITLREKIALTLASPPSCLEARNGCFFFRNEWT